MRRLRRAMALVRVTRTGNVIVTRYDVAAPSTSQ
jgi:hypothetical protein